MDVQFETKRKGEDEGMDKFSTSSTHITWNIRTKQRSRSINPNFKSLAFRPARITQPNLLTLTPLFPMSAFYPPLPLHRRPVSPSLFSFHFICVSLHVSFITHCLTIIHSIQSTLSLHILLFPSFIECSL